MSKPITKDEIQMHKERSLAKLNALLDQYITSGKDEYLKKANLISYWLESFSNYVAFEEKFDSTKLLRYKRGSVIRLNFGFNIGNEMGGLHYAVVVENSNARNSNVITVVPLSSSNGKNIHPRSVDLGTELFEKVNVQQQKLLDEVQSSLKELVKDQKVFENALNLFNSNSLSKTEFDTQLVSIQHRYEELLEKKNELEKSLDIIRRNMKEFVKMKSGSMAVINQITTISKQRIYTPKRSEDFLYGISLSPAAIDKINIKLKELFIFSKEN